MAQTIGHSLNYNRPTAFPLRAQTQEPIPKLTPNVFARIARWCFHNAFAVLAFWLLFTVLIVTACSLIYRTPKFVAIPFPSALNKETVAANTFAKLEYLQLITLTNSDSHALNAARDSIVSALAQRPDLFEAVVASGAGDYYDDYGLFYRPLSEVQSRVAYALALKPLFEAVKTAPDSASMSTLLSGIAGTIAQGRDPQGLDDMLAEAAEAVQALNVGEDHALDWSKIADLEIENMATMDVINVLPRAGQQVEAASFIAQIIKVAGIEASVSSNPTLAQKFEPPRVIEKTHLLAAAAMGLVFAALLLAILLGRFRVALLVFTPTFVVAPFAFLIILYLGAASWIYFWPIFAFCLIMPAAISLGLSLEAAALFQQVSNVETAVMLAAHYHGKRVLLRGIVLTIPFLCLSLLPYPAGPTLAAGISLLALLGLAASFSLAAALPRLIANVLDWRAAQWLGQAHLSLFETGQWQFLSHALSAAVVAISLFTTIASLRKTEQPLSASTSVAILASDRIQAEDLITRLRNVPSAGAVQWLGSFMPLQANEKLDVLHSLQGQFPQIEPVAMQNPADVRDVIENMQDSLRQISQAANVRISLKQSADALRQSLAILAATSEDVKLRQLNNRLFGGFNRTFEKAERVSSLKLPTLETLPPELQTLFGTPPGPYRLVVTPVEAVSPTQLADTLSQLGFAVAHPAVVAAQLDGARYATFLRFILAGAAIILVFLYVAAESLMGLVVTVLVGLAAALVLAAIESLWHQPWSLQWLLAMGLNFGWLGSNLIAAPRQSRASLISAMNVFLLPCTLLVACIPLALLGVDVIADRILPLAVDMLAVSFIIGLFQRHGAPAQRD